MALRDESLNNSRVDELTNKASRGKLPRRDFLRWATLAAAGTTLSEIAACFPGTKTETPSPEPVSTPRPTATEAPPPGETPRPELVEPSTAERLTNQLEAAEKQLEKNKKLLYGIESLSEEEKKEFRGWMMWDEENETEENKQRLKREYQEFRKKLKEEREGLEGLHADEVSMQALSAKQRAVVDETVGAIKKTEKQFDDWKQAKRMKDEELGQKLYWLRFRQTENEIKAKVESQPQGSQEWEKITKLYEEARLPNISTGRYLPANAELLEATTESLAVMTTAEAEEPCEEKMFVRSIDDTTDTSLSSKSYLHLVPRSTSNGKAAFGTIASGGSWTAGVAWKENGVEKDFAVTREVNESSIFDNTGVVVNYQGQECLANVACVVAEVDGEERSFVKAYIVNKETGLLVKEQLIHKAELGDFDDFSGSATFVDENGKAMAYWTHVGADGFNIKGVYWNETTDRFEEISGYLNDSSHRACQFGRTIGFDQQTGEYNFSYAYYRGNGNIGAIVHKTKLDGADGNSLEVMQVNKEEVLTNDDVSREILAGRIYSLIRVEEGKDIFVVEAPVMRAGKTEAELKVGITDKQGNPLATEYLSNAGKHRVVADIAVPEITFKDEDGTEQQIEVVAIRCFACPNKQYGDRESDEEVIVIFPDETESDLDQRWGENKTIISREVNDAKINIRRLYFGDIDEWLLEADGTLSDVWINFVAVGSSGVWGQSETTITNKAVCIGGRIYLPIIVKNQ